MSLQWTLIAGFLYIEVAIVLLLVLPIISPTRWHTLFKSRFLQGIRRQASVYFFVLLAILVLFLLDAIREMRKYSNPEFDDAHSHLDREMQGNMRLFRAQRNFYISGFALFLSLVIRRLVILITYQATLVAQSAASLRQAESATTAAKSLLAKQQSSDTVTKDEEDLKGQIKQLESDLATAVKDKTAVKKQADNLAKEYDRLAEEYSKLQKKITLAGGGGGESKKDD